MKALTLSPWLALMLKLIGAILIITSLIDYITLFTTVDFGVKQTIITFTTGVVDRGFIPLVGIVLLCVGFWVESQDSDRQSSQVLRLATLVIASILGLLFLLIVPWHVLTARDAAASEVEAIGKKADQVETQLEAQVKQLRGQGAQQLEAQLTELEKIINSGQLPADQQAQAQQKREELKRLKSNPKALEAEVEAQIGPKKAAELSKIQADEVKAKDQIQGNATRAALRTGLNSLLLAIGYAIVGWTGLRQLLYLR